MHPAAPISSVWFALSIAIAVPVIAVPLISRSETEPLSICSTDPLAIALLIDSVPPLAMIVPVPRISPPLTKPRPLRVVLASPSVPPAGLFSVPPAIRIVSPDNIDDSVLIVSVPMISTVPGARMPPVPTVSVAPPSMMNRPLLGIRLATDSDAMSSTDTWPGAKFVARSRLCPVCGWPRSQLANVLQA